jgi:hypothetical protein
MGVLSGDALQNAAAPHNMSTRQTVNSAAARRGGEQGEIQNAASTSFGYRYYHRARQITPNGINTSLTLRTVRPGTPGPSPISANIRAFYVRPHSIGVIARLDRAIQ